MPTFGKTTVGATTNGLAANFKRFTKFTAPADMGTVTDFFAYLDRTGAGGGYAVTVGVYTDNAGAPDALVANSSIVLNANIARNAPQWYSVTYTTAPVLTAGAVYWLGVIVAKDSVTYKDPAGANTTAANADTYTDGLANPFGSPSYAPEENSFYIVYTAGATAVGKNLQAIWDTRATVGKPIQAIWNIRAVVGKSTEAIWNVRQAVGKPVQAIWHVRQATGKSLQAVWNVRQVVGKSLQAIWNVQSSLVAVGKSLQAIWHVRQAVGKPVQTVWNVRQAVGKTTQAIWNVRQAVGKSTQAVWNVRQIAGRSTQAIWHVRQIVGKSLQAIWDVKINAFPGSIHVMHYPTAQVFLAHSAVAGGIVHVWHQATAKVEVAHAKQ